MVDVFASLPGRGSVEVEREIVVAAREGLLVHPRRRVRLLDLLAGLGASSSCAFASARTPTARSCGSAPSSTRSPTPWPRDVPPPLVKPRSIDDVPIWALTFWSPTQDSATLRQIAAEVENEIKTHSRKFRTPRSSEACGASFAWSSIRPGSRRGASRPARSSRRSPRPTGAPWPARWSPATGASWSRPAASSSPRASSGRSSSPSAAGGRCGSPTSRPSSTGPERPASYVTHGEPGTAGTLRRRHARGQQAPGRQRDHGRARDRAQARRPRAAAARRRRPHDGDARLRRDLLGEVERAPEAHGPRDPLGRAADGAGPRPPRGGRRAARRAGHARPDALRLHALRLHAQPDHALRPHLLDRHPRRRRDRRRREHRPAPAAARPRAGGRSRGSRSRRPTRSATRRSSRPSRSSRRSCRWASSAG